MIERKKTTHFAPALRGMLFDSFLCRPIHDYCCMDQIEKLLLMSSPVFL